MKIPLLDLVAQYRAIAPEIDAAVHEVLESGHFILGPQVTQFEQEVGRYLGAPHAVGVGSGTDALVLALRALDIGPGDEVILPTYTFFATAEAVISVGATPVLVDIDAQTLGIDVGCARAAVTARTRAMIPVHLFGQPADMDGLMALARERGLKVIEDNAQAIGAEYRGRKTGAIGDVGCLSFYPTKNLGACGDAGMVVTNDAAVAERIRMLRTHGWRRKYEPELNGYNSRLDELQAAILRVKLRHLDAWNARRREIAARYRDELADSGITVPSEVAGSRHVYHLYVVGVPHRTQVERRLAADGIASGVYYPRPLHTTGPCRTVAVANGPFPVADRCTTDLLAVPIYPEMSETEIKRVVTALREAVAPAS